MRELCADIVELRRGDHSAAKLKLEQDRLAEEREKTEDEVIEYFQKWAGSSEVRAAICAEGLKDEERERRIREIFGRPPEPAAEAAPTAPESNPV